MAKKVLIIDDEEVILTTMKDCFHIEGYDVITAVTGREGIEKAKTEAPDVIIFDVMLPDMNGNDGCRILKQEEGLDIPVIVATSKIDAVDAWKAREAGADDFAVKTTDYLVLLNAVKKILETS